MRPSPQMLVELREKQAAPVMRSLLAGKDLDENVKKRVELALRQLG